VLLLLTFYFSLVAVVCVLIACLQYAAQPTANVAAYSPA
jgi:hypothetical protein